jgi:hypothetical protein
MPTTRRRRVREMVNPPMPEWARRLLETGEEPEEGSPEGGEYFGWEFLDEPVPGLPPADSPEGIKLWNGEHRAAMARQAKRRRPNP